MSLRSRLLGGGDGSVERARRPEALADSLGGRPPEGIDWLGHPARADAPRLYRALAWLGRAFFIGLCRLRIEVEGVERLPSGGYIAVAALHRSWIDPLLMVHALPIEPRVWFLGSGPTAFDRPWKERLLRRTGGLLPVWRGGPDVSVHVRSAASALDEGSVLALFAEGRIGGPPDATARMRAGSALIALRTGAPVVPVAICGAESLHRGKRIRVRVLEPTRAIDLVDPGIGGMPAEGSRAEIDLAHQVTAALAQQLDAAVAEMHPATVDPPSRPKRWRWLDRLFRR